MSRFSPYTADAEIEAIGEGLIGRTLPKPAWTHAAHFAAALWIIERRPDLVAERDMPGLIRAYNEATGVANTDTEGYHETITQASLRAARAFRARHAPAPLFALCNALMGSPLKNPDWLLAYWRLRRCFPKRPGLPGCRRIRRLFFSEEKNQKTFTFSASSLYPAMAWICTLAQT